MTDEPIKEAASDQQALYEARKEEKRSQRQKKRYYHKGSRMTGTAIKWVVIVAAVLGGIWALVRWNAPDISGPVALPSEVVADDWVRGATEARVTVVEYSDFQCPACKSYEPFLASLLEDFPQDVRLVYRHFPLLALHPNARPAAWAAEAAGIQGQFWEMHDVLFDKQTQWASADQAESVFVGYARELGLNEDDFVRDFSSAQVQGRVETHRLGGERAGINSTPTFFVNGERIVSPRTYEEFRGLVEKELAGE